MSEHRANVVRGDELEDLHRSQQHIVNGYAEVDKKTAQIAKRIRSGAVVDNKFDELATPLFGHPSLWDSSISTQA
jgi:hypothetical protein